MEPGSAVASPSRPRGRPRSERAERAVLEATAAMLREQGFDSLTADGIAQRAGVSKATIYKWWPSKAAVAVDAFLADTRTRFTLEESGDVERDLRSMALDQLRLFRDTEVGRVVASLLAAAQTDPEVADALLTRWTRPRRERGARAITRARERGEIRADADEEIVLDLIFGPIYYRLMTGHGPLDDSLVDALVGTVVDGLRPAPRGAE